MALSEFQSRFLDLLLKSEALKFGSFKTKSGRTSPYFLNTGAFDSGLIMSEVAQCYGAFIVKNYGLTGLHLYGPAYKGITLACSTAMALAQMTATEVPFTFNRKEAKDHGEGGVFVGRDLKPGCEVIVIEDVLTGGTSLRESVQLLSKKGVRIRGAVVGVDRQERGVGQLVAAKEIKEEFGFEVKSILSMEEIVGTLWDGSHSIMRLGRTWITQELKQSIDRYRAEWGG